MTLPDLLDSGKLSTALLQKWLRNGIKNAKVTYDPEIGMLTMSFGAFSNIAVVHYIGENVGVIYNADYEVIGIHIEGIKCM